MPTGWRRGDVHVLPCPPPQRLRQWLDPFIASVTDVTLRDDIVIATACSDSCWRGDALAEDAAVCIPVSASLSTQPMPIWSVVDMGPTSHSVPPGDAVMLGCGHVLSRSELMGCCDAVSHHEQPLVKCPAMDPECGAVSAGGLDHGGRLARRGGWWLSLARGW